MIKIRKEQAPAPPGREKFHERFVRRFYDPAFDAERDAIERLGAMTHGKKVKEAKQIEKDGWDYPKHVAGRANGVVVHGDVAGVEEHRRNPSDWLDWMNLIPAGAAGVLDRYTGYYEPRITTAMKRSTKIATCRKKRVTWRARWRTRWSSCVPAGSSSPTRAQKRPRPK